jgi:hypothetical protein
MTIYDSVWSSETRHFSNRSTAFFTVDTRVLRCYKPQKDKLFGGESPNELHQAVASEAADLPGRAGLLSRREYCHATPTTPGGENEPVFTSFLFWMAEFAASPISCFPCSLAQRLGSVKMTLSFPPLIAGWLPPLSPA